MTDVHHPSLADAYRLGNITVRNRVVLAPMTRVSAEPDGTASDRVARYYRIFAAGGFGALITEALYIDTQHSPAYLNQPGIATDAHVRAWRTVVDGVHAEGAAIFAQLAHAGPQMQGNPYGLGPIGPSERPAVGCQVRMYGGSGPFPTPRAITADDIDAIHRAFVDAALRACEAGFNGVEIHGANGYLLDAFLTDYLNDRHDQYGASPQNRVRLIAEVVRGVRRAVGDDFVVGVRISQGKVGDHGHKWAGGANEAEVIFRELDGAGMDYIHTTEHVATAPAFEDDPRSLAALARQYTRASIVANGHIDTPDDAACLLGSRQADLVAIAKSALANRDWPLRARAGLPMNERFAMSEFGESAVIQDWELDRDALLGPEVAGRP
jgi:2,4-dienoyl-CoA reductase-like NADH-dependent reductase (Old Yellow Enzyme family)